MNLYFAYGLGICSEFSLPELSAGKEKKDIEIKQGKLDNFLRSIARSDGCLYATDSEVYHYYADVGSFFVRQGQEIIVDPAPSADERLLRLYLLGRIFGALLHQRGLLILHGSAVAVDGEAVAFLGNSGSGKSTAAASLIIKGYPMVADDLVAIDASGARPMVHPAFPQLKLWPDAAESLGYNIDTMPRISPKKTKRAANLDSEFLPDALPLRRIYILEKGEPTEILLLGRKDSMIELVHYSYAKRSLAAGANRSTHFLNCAKVASSVPVCRLIRPWDLSSFGILASKVVEDIERE